MATQNYKPRKARTRKAPRSHHPRVLRQLKRRDQASQILRVKDALKGTALRSADQGRILIKVSQMKIMLEKHKQRYLKRYPDHAPNLSYADLERERKRTHRLVQAIRSGKITDYSRAISEVAKVYRQAVRHTEGYKLYASIVRRQQGKKGKLVSDAALLRPETFKRAFNDWYEEHREDLHDWHRRQKASGVSMKEWQQNNEKYATEEQVAQDRQMFKEARVIKQTSQDLTESVEFLETTGAISGKIKF